MPEGFTIYEPGAPAGQESAVIGQMMTDQGWAPSVSYVQGVETHQWQAAPAAGIAAGGITGGVSGGEAEFARNTANLSALIPATTTALSTLLPGAAGIIGTIGAGAAGIYGLLQALGLGQGEGLFGNDLLGGDTQYLGNIPLGGPGLAEPPAQYVIKEWSRETAAGKVQYYRVQMPNMKKPVTLGYYTKFKRWVKFKAPHLAVIGKKLPSHRQLTRLKRNLVRHAADARTILKITSPSSLREPGRRGRR